MDGVHDLGGMHGFGPVATDDDAAFHAEWERLVFAMDRVLRSHGIYGVDEKRHAIERMPPSEYLDSSYFERWLAALETLLAEHSILRVEEIDARAADPDGAPVQPSPASDGSLASVFRDAFEAPAAFDRETDAPQFDPGDAVIVRNRHPSGHTRAPRYARRARGTIDRVHGTFVLPDAAAHGDDRASPLYSVRFTPESLWGPDHESPGAVYIDLWEPYLETP